MQMTLHLCIYKQQRRLDAYLAQVFPEQSRSFFQHLIESGSVFINEHPAKKASMELKRGDELRLTHTMPDTEWHLEKSSDIALDILYQDEHTVVINKPLGITVHPGSDIESQKLSIAHALLALPDVHFSIKDTVRPGIVHRLDKWTSGVLLAAKDDLAVHFYSSQFKNRSVTKEYIALVHGCIPQSHGFIEAPIGRSPKDRKKMAIVQSGKPAKTEFYVLKNTKEYTLLRVILHTGRTHQIRVHFANIGFPLVGDSTYSSRKNPFPKTLHGQFLHAWRLTFTTLIHEQHTVEAPLPVDFRDILQELDFLKALS